MVFEAVTQSNPDVKNANLFAKPWQWHFLEAEMSIISRGSWPAAFAEIFSSNRVPLNDIL